LGRDDREGHLIRGVVNLVELHELLSQVDTLSFRPLEQRDFVPGEEFAEAARSVRFGKSGPSGAGGGGMGGGCSASLIWFSAVDNKIEGKQNKGRK
jgi:hypothetical protein